MPGAIAYLMVGGVAAIATFVSTPLARKTAERFGVISAPDDRDVHELPTPHLGGPAMLSVSYTHLSAHETPEHLGWRGGL